MSHSMDPDQARHFIGPDLGSNCLTSYEIRLQQVKHYRHKI